MCVSADLESGPEEFAITNREELLSYYRLMYTMRRMEITCDNEYKVRSSFLSPPPRTHTTTTLAPIR